MSDLGGLQSSLVVPQRPGTENRRVRCSPRFAVPLRTWYCLCGLFALVGCSPHWVEVSGKATVDGKPLTKAGVFFAPDKDNTVKEIPRGWLDANGVYQLQTGDRKGCPPGWYKIIVMVEQIKGEVRPSPVNKKYLDPAKSPLSIQVVANSKPGAYDFNFEK